MGAVKTYKKIATIDAMEWDGSEESTKAIYQWASEYGVTLHWMVDDKLKIPTLEGPMYASVGDFIAKGIKDEFWAIKPDVMAATYEEVR